MKKSAYRELISVATTLLVSGTLLADSPNSRSTMSFLIAQSNPRACAIECNNEASRTSEQCQYDAQRATEDLSSTIDVLDTSAILKRTEALSKIAQERNRCITRTSNEAQRCFQSCEAGG